MPVIFPAGTLLTPVAQSLSLSTARVSEYRYELLNNNDSMFGELSGVQPGGTLSWDAYASIKSSGQLPVTDMDMTIDWLNTRIRPVVILTSGASVLEVPLGIYLCAAPVEEWSEKGRTWKVELVDKLSVLDQDIQLDANGNPITYGLEQGVNIISVVRQLITAAGESPNAIGAGNETLAASQVWETGTTTLKIINDLLTQAGYFSLWCDGSGDYRTVPYVPPAQRQPIYSYANPFEIGENSLLSPDWTNDQDIYAIPNRYVVIGQGDDTTPGLTATATNTNVNSPFSYPSRGRWITQIEKDVEATGQDALESYAERKLSAASSVGRSLEIKHLFLPEAQVNQVVRFVSEEANIDDLFSILKTTVTLDALAFQSSSIQEVLTA
jgi:hypothetical protein